VSGTVNAVRARYARLQRLRIRPQYCPDGYGSLHGYRGTETSLLGGFDNIDALVGTAYTDSLKGMNVNAAWHVNSLTAVNSGLDQYVSAARPAGWTSRASKA